MRISLVGPTHPFRGGIAHHTTLLYRHLSTRHDVRFFAFRSQYPSWLFPGRTDRDPSDQPLIEPGAERLLDSMNPVTWVTVARRIVQSRPDLVIFPWWSSFWTPHVLTMASLVRSACRASLLAVCHNVMDHEERRLSRLCARAVLGRMDHCLVHSEADATRLRTLVPSTSVTRAFHPVYDFVRPASVGKAEARARLDLAGDTILFFGFVRPYKGLDVLLRAMPLVRERRPVTLMVAGEFWGNSGEAFRRQIRELGLDEAVRCVDRYIPNEEVALYFAAADLVVLPYVSGTASGVVQTAYGLDKPVVATIVGALSEVVEDGRTGYLTPPNDVPALAEAIVRFFQRDQEAEFVANIRRHKRRFAWERLVEVIEETVGASRRARPSPRTAGRRTDA
jgi:glycosyltransferase involved in cell wall biosynthesis